MRLSIAALIIYSAFSRDVNFSFLLLFGRFLWKQHQRAMSERNVQMRRGQMYTVALGVQLSKGLRKGRG